MRLKPDKYHPRRLFQLNGDGKPYKFIYGNTELLVATALFAAGLVFVTLYQGRVLVLGISGILLSLLYIFAGIVCFSLSVFLPLQHIYEVRTLHARRTYFPDRIVYYHANLEVDHEEVLAKIPVPRKVIDTLTEEERISVKIFYKLKEIKYYQNQAENTLEHIKNLPTITETSVLIDDYQHAHQWYLKKAAEAEKWVADTLLKRAEDKEENEKRVEGIDKAVKEQTML
jgi:hypothetical protein